MRKEIADIEWGLDVVEKLLTDALAVMLEIEWKPVDNAQGPFCPSCENFHLWGKGHTDNCRLMAVIKRISEALK